MISFTILALLATPGLAAQTSAQDPAPARGWEFRGEGTAVPVTLADDLVPLPIAAVVDPGASGDRVLSPAAGDPDFLGFTAGPYFPPEDELIDPELLSQVRATFTDGRPSQATYAFVMFSKRMTPERLARLEELGCRMLGYHPHYTQRVALPADSIARVAALDFVRWIGAPKAWQKVHPRLLEELSRAPAGKATDVYVNVYDSDLGPASTFVNVGVAHEASPETGIVEGRLDERLGQAWISNGWQQRALERLGLDVVEYVDSIRAFRARMAPALLEQLVAQDFVQFVEPDLPAELAHDESMPMVNADYSRVVYDGSWNGNAMAGVIDSGLQIFHEALIPHVYIGWDVTPEGWAYLDNCKHGSHVAGTVWGAPPSANAKYTGVAPGLGFHASRRARVLKMFSGSGCVSSGTSHATLYSYMHGNYSDGTNVSPPPQAVNCSWGVTGSTSAPWSGSDAASRTLDQEVFGYGQMYVFAAGNEGSAASTLRSPAVAKNAFTVGSLDDYRHSTLGDPGHLSSFSSRGPCGDGRWKPNVVAPGSLISSVDAGGGNSAYTVKSGTSMAAPHVTGFAAIMADSDSYLHYKPHLMAGLMMSTALTNNDVVLTTPNDAHLDQFGTGMINTQTALYGATNVYAWGYQFGQDWSTWQYGDFGIYSGCKRLVVCMTYHEAAASSGASQALVNNFDLFLDSDYNGIDPNGYTGDYFAHQSGIDNTEIRIIDNPLVGTWRWKTYPTYVFSSVKMSITITAVYANTKPNGSLSVSASDYYVRPLDLVDIWGYAYNPEYFATNVFLDSTSTAVVNAATVSLFDGATANLIGNAQAGQDVLLGMLGPGYSRGVDWQVFWQQNGVHTFQVDARSENWVDKSASVQITVDGVAPVGPTNLASPSHPIGVQVCGGDVDFAWTAATDSLSGIDQYVALVDQSPSTVPTLGMAGSTALAGSATTHQASVAPGANAYYFHLRAIDRSGNYGSAKHYGPFFVHGIDVSTYCSGKINSLFCIPSMGWTGSPQIAGGNLTATCANVINNKSGLMFWGRTPQAQPFQGGTLCVQMPLTRTPSISSGGSPTGADCTGNYAFTFTQSYILSVGLDAGDDVYCQWWMRDPQSTNTTGLSNALHFQLCQ